VYRVRMIAKKGGYAHSRTGVVGHNVLHNALHAGVCVCVCGTPYACVSISPSTRKGAVDDICDIPFTATPHLGHPHGRKLDAHGMQNASGAYPSSPRDVCAASASDGSCAAGRRGTHGLLSPGSNGRRSRAEALPARRLCKTQPAAETKMESPAHQDARC
jgi:hypothetical protein